MNDLEVFEYEGAGYNPTKKFESWLVAIANHCDHFDKDLYNYIERHLETDEVFVLLSGKATMVTGMERTETPMETGKIYNVKKGSWHAMYMDKGSKVLIVENSNTTRENSEYHYFR